MNVEKVLHNLLEKSSLSCHKSRIKALATNVNSLLHGRSFTLYEQVHEVTAYGNRKIQHAFLKTLASILPNGCQPIIVSDAGFQCPWFKTVEAQGWYWVGRLHGSNHICTAPGQWISCSTLYGQATVRIKHYYGALISRKNKLKCNLYYLKEPAKFRKKKTKTGAIACSSKSQKYSRRKSKPWVIVTNLPAKLAKPKTVINLYKTRMQIEESFRDMKSHRFGFSLRYCLSRTQLRYANLLLIAMLASFIALVIGCYAEHKKLHYRYQANTIRERRVLSLQYLALEMLSKNQQKVTIKNWCDALIILMGRIRYALD